MTAAPQIPARRPWGEGLALNRSTLSGVVSGS